jgi:hypothetical protein
MNSSVFTEFAMVERFMIKTVNYVCLLLYSVHCTHAKVLDRYVKVCHNVEVRVNIVYVHN